MGNKLVVTDANGIATRYGYDTLDHLVVVTDALAGVVRYGYDGLGNKTVMTDANSHVTTYTYDALSRLVRATDPLSQSTRYGYDALGNRSTLTNANGAVTGYGYDPANRLTAAQYPSATVQYAYDVVGNRTAITDATGVTTYQYDAASRVLTTTAPTGVIGYRYDASNRTRTLYPDGSVVTSTYDAADHLISVSDPAGRVTTYSYDPAGRQVQINNPNNTTTVNQYDVADRLLAITHTSAVSGIMTFVQYNVDNVGNRLAMTDTDGVTQYVYDALYRLTQVTYPVGAPTSVSYAYDPMGNRVVMTDTAVTAYTYDAADQMLNAGATAFTWDANGNMLSKGGASYTWDAANRLVGVVSGTQTISYTYNGDGVRVGKNVNDALTAYAQDLAAGLPVVLAESTGGQTTRYVYGSDLVSQVDPSGNVSFYHVDGLGSVRALSNLAGQRTDAYSYDVFGATRQHTGVSGQPFQYNGEQIDTETHLVYLRARYYDPETGRFLSKDPTPGIFVMPIGNNPYAYALNNPTRMVDPDGELAFLVIAGTAAIGAAIGGVGYAVETWASGSSWHWGKFGTSVGAGALAGAAAPIIAVAGLGTVGAAAVTALVGASIGGVKYTINSMLFDGQDTTMNGAIGAWTEGAFKSQLGKLPKIGYSLIKGALMGLIRPKPVYAPDSILGTTNPDIQTIDNSPGGRFLPLIPSFYLQPSKCG